MSCLTSAVAMTTRVVGPVYLTGALHLTPAAVGLGMTAGPLVAALVGVPAGSGVDRFGHSRMLRAGLVAMAAGMLGLALVSPTGGRRNEPILRSPSPLADSAGRWLWRSHPFLACYEGGKHPLTACST